MHAEVLVEAAGRRRQREHRVAARALEILCEHQRMQLLVDAGAAGVGRLVGEPPGASRGQVAQVDGASAAGDLEGGEMAQKVRPRPLGVMTRQYSSLER